MDGWTILWLCVGGLVLVALAVAFLLVVSFIEAMWGKDDDGSDWYSGIDFSDED